MSLKGKVKWFNSKKGYGFIEREDKEKDVFVHASAVREAGLKFLNEGDDITFEISEGEKGPSAINLKKNS
jgi:cold shock protein|tara:strand:+ start:126 stop:335 length:210 start_codon:yes stop_codon:yes gene_type:complete